MCDGMAAKEAAMTLRPLGDAREHYWMTIKMGDALGLPLVEAWEDGYLSPDAYAEMITRCRGCAEPAACARLLDGGKLEKPPSYCANGPAWAELDKNNNG